MKKLLIVFAALLIVVSAAGFIRPCWSGDADCRAEYGPHSLCNAWIPDDLPRGVRIEYIYSTDCYSCGHKLVCPWCGEPFQYIWCGCTSH